MIKLYLIRHGQSEWNELKKIQGQKNTLLTQKGKKQASLLGKRLIDENIDIIYSSDLVRAFETANIIGEVIDKDVIPIKDLREINFGPWEGLTTGELHKQFKEEHLIWMKEPHNLKMQGLETLEELRERAMKCIEPILLENNDKNIAIVSHSATLKTLILGLLDMDLSFYNKISLNNVSLSIIECRDYNRVLTLFNDTCHLKELY
ncbi:histidine phosphatase family protein [Tissierella sp. MSJ-40]|uniref:Histidine phosphatase family protein n=1 Tax=Tissierella simiarum TaxID=2841534 RepID=A0ABS6E3W8_9FIRM|nr:histidine phosphatase family protein [Tissierella simiarum]MBU5437593.1 histidine phosphatase family protein [Tissierella simiarum]